MKEQDRRVLVFAEYLDHQRTPGHEAALREFISDGDLVCDLAATRVVSSDWLRFFLRLTLEAQKQGRALTLRGVRREVLETADLLALRKNLLLA